MSNIRAELTPEMKSDMQVDSLKRILHAESESLHHHLLHHNDVIVGLATQYGSTQVGWVHQVMLCDNFMVYSSCDQRSLLNL